MKQTMWNAKDESELLASLRETFQEEARERLTSSSNLLVQLEGCSDVLKVRQDLQCLYRED